MIWCFPNDVTLRDSSKLFMLSFQRKGGDIISTAPDLWNVRWSGVELGGSIGCMTGQGDDGNGKQGMKVRHKMR